MKKNINDIVEKNNNSDTEKIYISALYSQLRNVLLHKNMKGDEKITNFYLDCVILFLLGNHKKLVKLCHKIFSLNKQKQINLDIMEKENFYGYMLTSYLYTGQYKKCIKYGHKLLNILNNEKNKNNFLQDKVTYF
ncbi:hypothetical protein R4L22_12395 [Brachyspira pilosicoli]|uniref:hypothetical protein n=1 Tax=Brachyspira pilosicoli TaxID=52584 RepID=UPI0012F51BEF|nr:hypothetical protein [Brachyspira pilosicoli]